MVPSDSQDVFDLDTGIPLLLNEIFVLENEIKVLDPLLPALVYVSGYCVHSVLKKSM